MIRETGTFPSADGKSSSAYKIFLPEGTPRAAVLLSHGMCEYVGRYEAVAAALTEAGFVFAGADHIGHGDTAGSPEELGYLPKKGGKDILCEDLHTMRGILEARCPGLPVFLFGHSMGSFIARLYAVRHGEGLAGFIISGTGGPNPAAKAGRTAASLVAALRGGRHRSKMLDSLAFGAYNKRIENPVSKHDWLTKDAGVVARYDKDPYCNYLFTAEGFYVLSDLLVTVSEPGWAAAYPASLPTLILSGAEDPVGAYGKGPEEVARRLREAGVRDLTLTLCEGDRHEVHNETDRAERIASLISWMEARIG